jgi:arylsulfatase
VTYDTPWANVSNTPFKKYKRFLHEGGIITPCIIHWPAKIKPQKGYKDGIGHVIDLLPTSLEIAGASPKNLPGQSLSFLWNNKNAPTRTYCWEHEGNKAIRQGDWKLVKDQEDPHWELYDLKSDPCESKDLTDAKPEMVEKMIDDYTKWALQVGVKPDKN